MKTAPKRKASLMALHILVYYSLPHARDGVGNDVVQHLYVLHNWRKYCSMLFEGLS
jgi:hypothetical protein